MLVPNVAVGPDRVREEAAPHAADLNHIKHG